MPGFRLYAHATGRDDAARAKAGGAQAVIVPFAEDGILPDIAAAGVSVLVEFDPDRFPRDHPLVGEHPAAFSIQRDGSARARLDGDAGLPVIAALAERMRGLLDEGASGFRIVGIERIAPPVAATLIAGVRETHPAAAMIAGPLGDARDRAGAYAAAGVDAVATSVGYWDFAAPWFVEELAALAGVATLAEVRGDQLGAGDDPGAVARRLFVAAATAGGLILPAALFSDGALIDRVAKIGTRAATVTGETRSLSGAGAPVTALLRADASDVRCAETVLVVLVNRTSGEAPAPDPAVILPAAGVALRGLARVGRGDPFAPLTGGEVRLLTARRGKPVAMPRADPKAARAAAQWPRLVVEGVTPIVEGGPFPVKRVVGDRVPVDALVYADGHEQLAAEILWRGIDEADWSRARMTQHPNDRWSGSFVLPRLGRHEFAVEGWLDVWGGYRRDFAKKLDAGVAQPVDYEEGRTLVARAAKRHALGDWPQRLAAADGEDLAALLLSDPLAAAMDAADERPHRLRSEPQPIDAERLQARFSSWYELFPRSMGKDGRHGTLRDVIDHLPRVRAMGFDTLYFPPIHPIGKTNRKGPNNTLTPAEGDPGSPYAIGSADGGHEALHPELGSFEDFARLTEAARAHELEIAIDFAIQCSPDHPWLKDHPGWFDWRPDGTIKYAENPPKKYQDIVNVDFYARDAVPSLWCALRDVVLIWCGHGVKTFRVDNPHTKPLPFWQWMIAEVRAKHPDAIFLAEAFTRPAMMYRLAKIGFSQSYTYFTWRNGKQELIDYIEELTTTAPKDFYRPHFFVNTPDINPIFLQTSGPAGFKIRAVLAATLSGLFGVYSGFELCDGTPLPGKEEYLDSEKFELRPRDWNAQPNIVADITLLNRLRRARPALQTHLGTRFYAAGNDNILWYGKLETGGTGMILVMVSLDPHGPQECAFDVPLWEMGLPDDAGVQVEDLAHGYRFEWHGKTQTIRLDPEEPYRIWRVAPWGTL